MEQNWVLGKINANKLAKTPRELMEGAIKHFKVKPDNLQIAVGSNGRLLRISHLNIHQLWGVAPPAGT